MLVVKRAINSATNFYGVHIPVGALYAVVPEKLKNGVVYPRLYVWITRAPRENGGIYAYTMTREKPYPRQEYFRANHPFTQAFYTYCISNSITELHCKPVITKRDAAQFAPKDRLVGAYIQRAHYGAEYHSRNRVNDISVTEGCRVGAMYYSEVGYTSEVMRVGKIQYASKAR